MKKTLFHVNSFALFFEVAPVNYRENWLKDALR